MKTKVNKEYGSLTLTRKLGESITIGDNILVTVAEVKGKQVRLMFNAPKDVAINRVKSNGSD